MMRKDEFLAELRCRISVLEHTEQEDILAEYSQHIDLRMAGGLTEEEAILDFGDIGQLAAEILEAYHVDPAAQELGAERPAAAESEPAEDRRASLSGFVSRTQERTSGLASRAAKKIGAFFRTLGRGIRNFFTAAGQLMVRFFHFLTSPFRRKPAEEPAPEEPRPSLISRTVHSAGRGVERGAGWLVRFVRSALRLCWNLLLLACALPLAVLLIAALVGLGVLVTLLVQGYPLVGLSLLCLGGTLVLSSILVLGSALLCRRSPADPLPAQGPAAAEECSLILEESILEKTVNEEDIYEE